jgi:DNA-binding response OmpR family regulator
MKPTILIIDDSEDTTSLVTQTLENDFEVLTASNWGEASTLLFRSEIRLVLLDVNLPVVTGPAIAEALRKAKFAPKVLLHSAMDESELRTMAKSVGAAGYIAKPCTPTRLRATIDKHLSAPKGT